MRIRRSAVQFLMMLPAAILLLSQLPLFAATTGSVAGRITDAETGQALSGVNIRLDDTNFTTITDDNGFFLISNIAPGTFSLSASLVGYAPATITGVGVQMDISTRIDVSLMPTIEEEPEVIIIESRRLTNPDATQTLYTRTGEDQALSRAAPNSFYQVPDVVSTVPGVVQDEFGNPHIRGGRDDEIGWMIEGIPVTNPIDNTFGTNLVTVGLSKMQVYTGGYQAEYGNAISGILNEIKLTGSDLMGARYELTGGAQSHAGVYAEAGNMLSNGLEWYLGNYSWRSDFKRFIAEDGRATDSVMKVVYPVNDANKLTVLGSVGSARYGIPVVSDPPEYLNQDHTSQGYGLFGLTWSHTISPTSHFLLRPYYFMSKNNINALSTRLGDSAISRSTQRGILGEYETTFDDIHQLKAGFWYISGSNHFNRFIPDLALQMIGDPDFASMFDPFEYSSNVRTRQHAFFVQDKIRVDDDWVVDAGLRYDRMYYRKAANPNHADGQVSPRVGVAWSKDPRTVVRASYGRFIQFTPTMTIDRVHTNPMWDMIYAPDAILNPERASSYEVSLERQLSESCLLRVTPYYRQYRDLLDRVPLNPEDPMSPLTFASSAEANARGIEFYLDGRLGPKTRGWLSYTLSRTRANSFIDPSVWTYVGWDQRHTADATIVHTDGLMDYSMRLQFRSGLPWTFMTADPETGEPMGDQVEHMRRMPSNFVVTAGVTRRLGASPDSGAVSLHIYNLLNSLTETSRDFSGQAETYVFPRFVSLSFTQSL